MKKTNKKGQMKIQQMAFMLIGVTLFFVLAGLFLLTIYLSSIRQGANDLNEENAKRVVTSLADSPEFSCENAFSSIGTSCIDFDKVMILKKNIGKYNEFWNVAEIKINKIYPKENAMECTESTYPKCNSLVVYSKNVNKGPFQSNFVSLCRKDYIGNEVYDKCEMAQLLISYETIKVGA
jgi:hypothetical protein